MLPAVLAALALLTQLMIPGASLAYEARATGAVIVMCTTDGAVAVVSPDSAQHGKGFGGLKCHDCVMASIAAIGTGPALSVPVRYADRLQIALPGQDRPQIHARAPPRPPSTAPPATQTA